LVLKKCRKSDDVLFINASEHFTKDKRQNRLDDRHIDKIVATYQYRIEEAQRKSFSNSLVGFHRSENGGLATMASKCIFLAGFVSLRMPHSLVKESP
jgi:type I restriction-modification system DNA methylase subunit